MQELNSKISERVIYISKEVWEEFCN